MLDSVCGVWADIRKDKKLEERFDRGTQKFVVGHVLQTKCTCQLLCYFINLYICYWC